MSKQVIRVRITQGKRVVHEGKAWRLSDEEPFHTQAMDEEFTCYDLTPDGKVKSITGPVLESTEQITSLSWKEVA